MSLPIIGVGASAGGLKEFERLFKHIPEDLSAAIVVIQHLSAQYDSMLPDILSRYTRRDVQAIESGMVIKPKHVYVIPPKKAVVIEKERLKLIPLERNNGKQLPLDTFFESLAEAREDKAIGIILSGMGNDGTTGAKAIKAAGGLILAQALDTTVYEEMPRHALEAGMVDLSLPVSAIPKAIHNYIKNSFQLPATEEDEISDKAERIYDILSTLKKETGQDFSNYKSSTIQRRIKRRVIARHLDSLEDYQKLLERDKEELQDLQQDLLVSVTSFFRDAEVFEYAYEHIVPAIVEKNNNIRIWIAGCATGEEAYTWAILFQFYLKEHKRDADFRIFATDIDKQAIEKARKGFYYPDAIKDIPKKYVETFFETKDSGYTLKKYLREKIIFAVQNLIQDPPYSQLDLLSCRNLLIYFNKDLQKHANTIFSYALKEGGYLLLGNAEAQLHYENIFEVKHPKFKIYQRKEKDSKQKEFWNLPLSNSKETNKNEPKAQEKKPEKSLREQVQAAILDKYAPPSVLINRKKEILYVQGNLDKYLEFRTGEMSYHIIQVAREQFKWPLSNNIRMALNKNKRIEQSNLQLELKNADEEPQHENIDIIIMPLDEEKDEYPELWLITFKESKLPSTPQENDRPYPIPINLYELEKELAAKENHLQRTIEKLESTNQELNSANEEAQSANEELQSTNEELETSKEELQSVNEELTTTNNELAAKVEEINHVSDTLNNLLSSTDIATLFLNKDLEIFRFTPAISSIIGLIDTDMGRSIKQFTTKLLDNNWLDEVQAVLNNLEVREKEVETSEGRYFWMRILPYHTNSDAVEGVVITFTDITEKKQQEIELERHRHHLEDLVKEKNRDLKRREKRFTRIAHIASDYAFGYKIDEKEGRQLIWSYGDFNSIAGHEESQDPVGLLRGLIPEEHEQSFDTEDRQLLLGKTITLEHPIITADGSIKWVQFDAVPDWDEEERRVKEVVCTLKDVSKRKKRSAVIENNERLLSRTEHIAHVGSWQMRVDPAQPEYWSDEMFRIFGIPIQNAPPPYEEALQLLLEKDVQAADNILQEVQKTKESFQMEISIRRPDGEVRHCLMRGYPQLNSQGKVLYLYGSLQDITERKQMEEQLKISERKFRSIADNVPGLVLKYRLKPDGSDDLLYLSKGVENLYEISRKRAMQDINLLWARLHPDDVEGYQTSLKESAESLSFWEREHRILMPDGRVKWIHARATPVKEKDGSVIWDTLGVEITQQKRAQEKLREREESLKKINATKDKLFSIIGHDLKAPLSNIIGLAELIQMNEENSEEQESTEEIQQLTRHMHQSAKNLARLLDNLLTWSRSQMNKIYYQPTEFRLRMAADSCIDLIRPQASKKDINIYNEIPEQEEAFGDKDMIVVVMRNLLSNAVKFTFLKGKINVHSQPKGEHIVIGISDSGVGIPERLLKKIMASDTQVTTLGTSGEKGTGLGLSICKDFIQKNGGQFWVESEEGKGSTFYFTLPKTEKGAEASRKA